MNLNITNHGEYSHMRHQPCCVQMAVDNVVHDRVSAPTREGRCEGVDCAVKLNECLWTSGISPFRWCLVFIWHRQVSGKMSSTKSQVKCFHSRCKTLNDFLVIVTIRNAYRSKWNLWCTMWMSLWFALDFPKGRFPCEPTACPAAIQGATHTIRLWCCEAIAIYLHLDRTLRLAVAEVAICLGHQD